MIKASVLGATGYAGQELVRLLVQHPQVELHALTSQNYAGKSIVDVFPSLKGHVKLNCSPNDLDSVAAASDIVFLALPHGAASKLLSKEHVQACKIIDLGGDFRFKNTATYESWYQTEHGNPGLNEAAVYGLAEWNHEAIAGAQLVANPGCYATAASLALLPLIKQRLLKAQSLIVDAKSGVSGAGRAANQGVHFNECNETIKAYGLTSHKHTPEIEEQLQNFAPDAQITFTPHLVPMNRGILVTAYGELSNGASAEAVLGAFEEHYGGKPFIRLADCEQSLPETRWVKGSNFCDIGCKVDSRTGRAIVVAALDNLVKGAAGQAVQNMNLMFGLPETTGLLHVPLFPG